MKLRWFFGLVFIVFVWGVIGRSLEFQRLIEILIQTQWLWVLSAAVLQIIFYINYAGLYRSAFHTVEIKSRVGELLPVIFASTFLNVTASSESSNEAVLVAQAAEHHGQPTFRSTPGRLLVLAADFSSLTVVLVAGLAHLFLLHGLEIYEIIATLSLLAVLGGLAMVLLLGLRNPDSLTSLLVWLQSSINRLGARVNRPHFVEGGWAERNANEFTEAALAIATHPQRLARSLLIAFGVQILNLASLYALFLAFHQPVGFGVLVTGFAMGVLFRTLSIPPQGIGVVPGVMILVYASLGIPLERAILITLSFRVLNFVIPLGFGFLFWRRLRGLTAPRRFSGEIWSVRWVAIFTGLMGVINVVSAVTPRLHTRIVRMAEFSPLGIQHGGRLTAALAGFALLLLASNLWRRKRVAWLLTLLVLLISSLSHLIKGPDYEESFLAITLVGWLLYLRPHFHARSDPPSIWQGLRVLAFSMVFTVAYGVTGFYLMDHQFRVNFGLSDALRQTFIMLTQFYDPGLQPITGLGRYFADSIYIVGAVTMGYSLLMLVRPVLARHGVSQEDRLKAQQIVQAYGCTSLARLALMDDKRYYFSVGGSVIAYILAGRVALALGDPIGPQDDIPKAIADFRVYCAQNDWAPAFYQVLPDYLDCYTQASFNALCIGHEGIVDWENFSLQGKTNKGLRSGYNRIKRIGYHSEVFEPPLNDELLASLRLISDEWLTTMNGTEKKFSLGWFDDDYVRGSQVIAIYNPNGEIEAFANILPEYQKHEIAIDLMRHTRDAENGLMDFLFVELFLWAKEKGYATFSLGLSALSGIGEAPQDPAIERTLHYIYEHVNQFYNFKGVHEFKEKFHPSWSPRYLIYPGLPGLPLVTIAMIRADSGDDLLGGYFRI